MWPHESVWVTWCWSTVEKRRKVIVAHTGCPLLPHIHQQTSYHCFCVWYEHDSQILALLWVVVLRLCKQPNVFQIICQQLHDSLGSIDFNSIVSEVNGLSSSLCYTMQTQWCYPYMMLTYKSSWPNSWWGRSNITIPVSIETCTIR